MHHKDELIISWPGYFINISEKFCIVCSYSTVAQETHRTAEIYKNRLCLSVMGKAFGMKTANSANGFHACQGVPRL